jgi:PhnB protein
MSDVNPFGDGYPRVTPYVCIDDGQAAAAIDFYVDVLGAVERMRMGGGPDVAADDERIGHAELMVGDGLIMLSDAFPDMNIVGPKAIGGTPVTISVYVTDVDAAIDRAVARGATIVRPIENQFYGDRSGQILDPFGHRWSIATHIEDVSPEEMEARMAAMGGE